MKIVIFKKDHRWIFNINDQEILSFKEFCRRFHLSEKAIISRVLTGEGFCQAIFFHESLHERKGYYLGNCSYSSLAELCRNFKDLNYHTIKSRLRSGWDVGECFGIQYERRSDYHFKWREYEVDFYQSQNNMLIYENKLSLVLINL